MNAHELNEQLLVAAQNLRDALADLEQRSREAAKTEKDYRMAKATAYLSTSGTVAEREAHAERAINDLRFMRDMADGLKVSGLEAVRSYRTILSAAQTIVAMYRTEAEFDKVGPA